MRWLGHFEPDGRFVPAVQPEPKPLFGWRKPAKLGALRKLEPVR